MTAHDAATEHDDAPPKVPPGHVFRWRKDDNGDVHCWTERGPEAMARRDSFAMAALSGMDSGSDTPAIWARWAYQVADAMEIERNKLGKDDT